MRVIAQEGREEMYLHLWQIKRKEKIESKNLRECWDGHWVSCVAFGDKDGHIFTYADKTRMSSTQWKWAPRASAGHLRGALSDLVF